MILEIRREDAQAVLGVDSGLGKLGYARSMFLFKWNCGTEWAALLLIQQLQRTWQTYKDLLYAAAYRQGWADTKAKRAKQY